MIATRHLGELASENAGGLHQNSIGRIMVFIASHSPVVPNNDLVEMASESVMEGLDALGDGISNAVLYHLSIIEGLTKEELALDVDALAEGLEKMFGEGSRELELLILRSLKTKLAEYLSGTDIQREKEQTRIDPA